MRHSELKWCGLRVSDVVGSEYQRKLGGVVCTLPWARGDVGEVAGVVVAECGGVGCVSVSVHMLEPIRIYKGEISHLVVCCAQQAR